MTPDQERALLEATTKGLDDDLREAYARVVQMIRDGMAPRDAVDEALRSFAGEFEALLTQAFGAVLAASVGSESMIAIEVGAVQLSARIYSRSQETAQTIQGIVTAHTQGFADARALMLEIFEGYGFKVDPLVVNPRNPALPRYLRDLFADGGLQSEFQILFARAQVDALKSPALKAAYLEALDALEAGKGALYLEKKMEVAWNEKMRYFARRIAETELHRAYSKRRMMELLGDDDVEYVEIRRSGRSEWACICDLIAGRDKYGMGRGVYPKTLAPVPPFHPHCLPGDALITSAIGISAVSKRWYDGDMVVITTASGKRITATVNHPILTGSGWIGAGLLDVGCNVVSRVDSVSVAGYTVIGDNHKHMPTSIAEIADSFFASSEVSAREVPESAEDFHGDGMAGQIAVIGANSKLWDRLDSAASKVGEEHLFNLAHASLAGLLGDGVLDLGGKALLGPSDSVVGVCSKCAPLLGSHFGHPNEHGLTSAPDSDSGALEDGIDWAASDAELARYIQAGSTGDVFLDDVISVDRFKYSGHVYNLETEQGHYTCNGIVTHNCRCVSVARTDIPLGKQWKENPEADQYFLRSVGMSMSARIMGSKAKAEAALKGADPIKIANAGKPEGYQIKTAV